MLRPTWDTSRLVQSFVYGAFTLYGRTFQTVLLLITNTMLRSRNPNPQAGWFRLFRVRSPLLTESLLFSSPQGTEMFHFPWCSSEALCIQTPVIPHDRYRVAPFGNLRIKACLPLPEAYRSLPRPSSPTDAKASIVRPFALNHKKSGIPLGNPDRQRPICACAQTNNHLSGHELFALSMQLSKNSFTPASEE